MNIRDLQYLVAVADLGHFGKAAERCNVSQPTLSMQIKKLSELLDVPLFEHSGKAVQLTPVAKEIVLHARIILDQANQIVNISRASKNETIGDLTIGLPGTLGPYLLPLFIDEFCDRYPKMNISFVEEKTVKLLRRVDNGRLDCALLATSYDSSTITGSKLFDEPYYLAVARGHPLAKKKTVTMSDIENQPLLLLDESHCWNDNSSDVCRMMGFKETNSFRATSIETLRQLVAKGDHVTLMPKLAIIPHDLQVAYIPFKAPVPRRTISLIWRKKSPRAGFFAELHEWLALTLSQKII